MTEAQFESIRTSLWFLRSELEKESGRTFLKVDRWQAAWDSIFDDLGKAIRADSVDAAFAEWGRGNDG